MGEGVDRIGEEKVGGMRRGRVGDGTYVATS